MRQSRRRPSPSTACMLKLSMPRGWRLGSTSPAFPLIRSQFLEVLRSTREAKRPDLRPLIVGPLAQAIPFR